MKSALIIPCLFLPLFSQVRINEFMASNARSVPDITDFEDYPDWIELHNPGATAVNLDGYFLSDNPNDRFKWAIPAGASIPAGGYFMIIADGHGAGPGESFPRGYWPWRSFDTEKYHTNFNLSSDGESVVLTQAVGVNTTSFIGEGATWKYLDDGSAQSTQWRARTYNDIPWASGPAPLGYDNGPATEISFGPDENGKYITSYFRHTFNITDPSIYTGLTLRLLVDDGAVVYLNGEELFRQNMPTGTIVSSTTAEDSISGSDETDFTTYQLPPSHLISGDNVIAVEVHQSSDSSSDLGFDLSLESSSFTSVNTLDSITYGTSVTDISFGRDITTPTIWQAYAEPTPGAANTSSVVTDIRLISSDTDISPAAGLYTAPESIVLTATAGNIHYTLDGSDPSSSSPIYSAPIAISTTTIVRARVFESGKVPGPIATATYLYGEVFNGLPIVSVVADPKTLFGDEIGIYDNDHEPISSGMNEVYKGKDAPGHVEFFPHDSSEGFAVNGGIRIGGENNWGSHEQKAFNISLRGKYGDDNLKYDLFPGSGIPNHTAFTLREGGDDWDDAMLRDGMWNSIAKGYLNAETTNFRPSVVFLNGEYWGIYNLRSRWTEEWLFEKYGVSVGEYDHVGYGHFNSSSTTLGAQEGEVTEWQELLNFIDDNDINTPAGWTFVESRVDLDSFIDFIVSESFANNTSWAHNREFWKAHTPGSRWKWFLPDMDRTFKIADIGDNEFDSILRNDALLDRIKNQPEFQARLAQRYAAHISATFNPTRIANIVDTLGALITPELDRHKAKWSGSIDAAEQATDLQEIKDYATQRSTGVHAEISAELGIGSAVDMTLVVTGSGTVHLAGVPVNPGNISIFPNLDASLLAVPAPGFQFDSWAGVNGDASTILNTSGAIAITANFIPAPGTVVGGTLASNTTFSLAGSPYFVESDLIVPGGITLTVNAGVNISLKDERNIRVIGTLDIQGTLGSEVTLQGCNGERWGGVSFEEPVTTSTLAHVIVRDASRGHDPTRYPAAIAGLNATVELDFIDIRECRGPLFFRGGSTYLRDSLIHIPITGDGINIKTGYAETIRCTFLGNNAPDTDAIDYDGVTNGIIRDCYIYNFQGFNSDGIDTGEQCVNVLIEGCGIYFNSDKGISVGQGSSVILRKNIIVGCPQGVGVKDFGSTILIDQNTFVDCAESIAVFEKNFGNGGGHATVTNNIISGSDIPVSVDSYSTIITNYNLSDTIAISGTGNLLTNPMFVDADSLNFQLQPGSPAINSGDPAHALDPDSTRVDMGAAYLYQTTDYPFTLGKTVVVNEILTNSGASPDWIELHNRTNDDIDIGGWFLSDSALDLAKYRIPVGTIIPAGGFRTFYEDLHFGAASADPNRITGFGLSDDGETVYLSSAENDQLTDYRFKEDFGASLPGEAQGYYYKSSSNSYNFLPLASPTPQAPNDGPRIGPIVISEIMYHPAGNGDAEYLELLNVSDQGVTLFEAASSTAWRFTSGIGYEFPAGLTIALAPGERLILTSNIPAFNTAFTVPAGTQVLEWTTGGLSNGGEAIQLGRPGPVDANNFTQYVRVDRVNYEDSAPWPTYPDGAGPSLSKIAEQEYGNDYINWISSPASPGDITPGERFSDWATINGVTDEDSDDDGDGITSLMEYAFNTNPNVANFASPLTVTASGSSYSLNYNLSLLRTDVNFVLQSSPDLQNWMTLTTTSGIISSTEQSRSADLSTDGPQRFHRLQVTLKP
ncbi:MAG: lamin tail domain-containing protein [Akkermansiaceae bacterium]|nr:lamin tail domain-containing protein [Akkermansiaceae bacterium]MDG2324106.1 lamin tail domain-containing protein [Akkermansiaceae bacterium]